MKNKLLTKFTNLLNSLKKTPSLIKYINKMDLSENVEFGEELLTITCFKIMHNIFYNNFK